jgi:hypothetical protein
MRTRRMLATATTAAMLAAMVSTSAVATEDAGPGAFSDGAVGVSPQRTPEFDESISGRIAQGVASEILSAATDLDREFDGVSVQWDEERELLVVWVDPDADIGAVRRAVEDLRLEHVQVESAPYSAADLQGVADRLVTAGTLAGAEVQWAGPAPDRSGVDVGVDRAVPQTRAPAEIDGIPVSPVVDGEISAASRDLDSAPFNAGAVIFRVTSGTWGKRCTTAFAIRALRGGTYEDQLLTAEHCGREGSSTTWRTGLYTNTPIVGDQTYGGTDTDIMKLRGQSYGPYMYYGPKGANTAVAVKGHAAPFAGMYIHHSGASSGVAYNSVVTHTGLSVNYGDGLIYHGITRAVHPDGLMVAGNGDSGGPVFALDQNGYVHAVGIISGISDGRSSCRGEPADGDRKCSDITLTAELRSYFAANPGDYVLSAF